MGKGLHATFIHNLQYVLGLRPGSIYSTAGSKASLFKKVLAHYKELGILNLNRFRNETNSPIKALENFVERAVVNPNKARQIAYILSISRLAH
ncbi:hypothetical protein [Vibrio splendidus]|uniref:hypothetical protein n=1 Tax=Vibrio splendidus TaxID=29497 RepID=UPI00021C27C6|nr:Transcriptional regulator, TetR family protein [Vibrio splendidus ATCC 33789]